jgi:5-(hydroxymethyl)furfural/furfural oxidase
MDNPDFLVIGGGSAGAVVAARLSEDPATRVLLVEAGPDTPPEALPADIADTFPTSSLNPDYFWPGLQAVRSSGSPARPFPQARIMGGGSSVMGLWALRGVPSDFDAWTAAGAEGWGWTDLLPYFANWKTISTAIKARPRAGRTQSAGCRDTNGPDLYRRSSERP